ncbi:unnamed protein product [Chrysodeixis includens]|uniref:Uncharacterized protein n=1 Tax=Chrysodeixis includens TaxID=689277 RepID=A0A9N8KTY4_CHRIL|nr:unnamed protein product [Chrysodeixis includens]
MFSDITGRSFFASFNASLTVGTISSFVMIIEASDKPICLSISYAVYTGFRVVTTPPAARIPKSTMGYSGTLGRTTPIVSPSLTLNFFLRLAAKILDFL